VTILTIAFIISFAITTLLVRYEHIHTHFSGDSDFNSPQKFHNTNVSRIGGFSILLGLIVAGIFRNYSKETGGAEIIQLILVSLPAFIVGLTEDLTKRVGITIRFTGICIAALIFGYVFNTWISNVGVNQLNTIFVIPLVSIAFTVFAITGLTNAYNIIDGFNGLASLVAVLTLGSLCYVGFKVNDPLIFILGMVMIGSIFGFFFWNYPKGNIFLGDGGAYIIGFWIASLTVLLVTRNQEISPFYALLVNAYPAVETIFTIWRRKFHKNKNPGIADDMHLHTLVYRRVVRWDDAEKGSIVSVSANARTSPYIWLLAFIGILPATIFWDNQVYLITSFILFCGIYLVAFLAIIRFKVPKWIK
jgi:UDP-N-acetylmuramyl pentapeptide phosphotransferase/UDP-N-acetylglucosamine-1-phosphate transferase